MEKIKNRKMLKHNSQKLSIFFNIINPKINLFNKNPGTLFNYLHKLKLFIKRLLSFFKLDEKKLNLYNLSYNDENVFSPLYDNNIKNINVFNNYRKNSTFFKCLIYFLSNNKNKIREKITDRILTAKNELTKKNNIEVLNNEYSTIKIKNYNFLFKNIYYKIFNNLIKMTRRLLSTEIKDYSENKNFSKNKSLVQAFKKINMQRVLIFFDHLIYNYFKSKLDFYNLKRINTNSDKKNHYNNLLSHTLMFSNKKYNNDINRYKLRLDFKQEIIYNLIKAVKKINKSGKKLSEIISLNKYNTLFLNSEKLNNINSTFKNYNHYKKHAENIKKDIFKYFFKKKINISKYTALTGYSEGNIPVNKFNFIKNIKLLRRINFYKNRINKSNNVDIKSIKNQLEIYKNLKRELFNKKINNRNSRLISSSMLKNSTIFTNEIMIKVKDEKVFFMNADEWLFQYHTDNITTIDSDYKFNSFFNNRIFSNNIFKKLLYVNSFFKSLKKRYLKNYNNKNNINSVYKFISFFKLNNNRFSSNKILKKLLNISGFVKNLNKLYLQNYNTASINNDLKSDFNSINLYKNDIQSIENIKKNNYKKNINNEIIRKKVNIKHYDNIYGLIDNKKNNELLMNKKDEIMKILKIYKGELLEIINDAMKINKRLEY